MKGNSISLASHGNEKTQAPTSLMMWMIKKKHITLLSSNRIAVEV